MSTCRHGKRPQIGEIMKEWKLLLSTVLAALTGAVGPAYSQEQRGSPDRVQNTSDTETDFIRQMIAIGSLSLSVSRLAEQRISVPKLKQFAQFEIAWQQQLAEVMKSLQASRPVNEANPPSDQELEQNLVPLGRQTLDNMRAIEPGIDFSRAYFLLQNDAQQQLLRLQEGYLKVGKNPAYVGMAKIADQMTREHLQLLAEIKADMTSGKGAAPVGR